MISYYESGRKSTLCLCTRTWKGNMQLKLPASGARVNAQSAWEDASSHADAEELHQRFPIRFSLCAGNWIWCAAQAIESGVNDSDKT